LVITNKKLEKRLRGRIATASLRPVRVVTDVELSGDGEKRGERYDFSSGPRFPRFSPFWGRVHEGNRSRRRSWGLPFI